MLQNENQSGENSCLPLIFAFCNLDCCFPNESNNAINLCMKNENKITKMGPINCFHCSLFCRLIKS